MTIAFGPLEKELFCYTSTAIHSISQGSTYSASINGIPSSGGTIIVTSKTNSYSATTSGSFATGRTSEDTGIIEESRNEVHRRKI